MGAEIRRLKFLEGVNVATPMSYSVVSGFSGSVNLSNGDASKSVSFSSPMPDTNYKVVLSIECPDDNPVFLSYNYKNKTVNGFDIVLNGPVDSDNYKISYTVTA